MSDELDSSNEISLFSFSNKIQGFLQHVMLLYRGMINIYLDYESKPSH